MKAFLLGAAALLAASPLEAAPVTLAAHADKVARADTIAWDFVEGITTEVGPRQAGTRPRRAGAPGRSSG